MSVFLKKSNAGIRQDDFFLNGGHCVRSNDHTTLHLGQVTRRTQTNYSTYITSSEVIWEAGEATVNQADKSVVCDEKEKKRKKKTAVDEVVQTSAHPVIVYCLLLGSIRIIIRTDMSFTCSHFISVVIYSTRSSLSVLPHQIGYLNVTSGVSNDSIFLQLGSVIMSRQHSQLLAGWASTISRLWFLTWSWFSWGAVATAQQPSPALCCLTWQQQPQPPSSSSSPWLPWLHHGYVTQGISRPKSLTCWCFCRGVMGCCGVSWGATSLVIDRPRQSRLKKPD